MRLLYIFPHPDDESFGPAAGIDQLLKNGHEVYLLTLTKGGATKQRHKAGLSVKEMGEVRYNEMLEVKKVLGLTGMTVMDFPDSGLKEMDPRVLEKAIEQEVLQVRPDIVVSYPVHGISGFHDHLITHAVVKRVFLDLKDKGSDFLKRLAFYTLPDSEGPTFTEGSFRFKQSEPHLIDCIMHLSQQNINAMKKALECYKTYQNVIKETNVIEKTGDKNHFEIFNESFDTPLNDITENMPG